MSTQLIAHLKKKCEADDNVKILLSQWEFDQKLVSKALENIGGFYPHFSNHNASHSQQILVNIERLLGDDIELLTATDTWLILESAYWHDVGMLVDAKNAKEVHKEENFKKMLREIVQNKSSDLHDFAKVFLNDSWQGAIALEKHPFDGVEKYRQLIAEYFRKEHANRIGDIVLEDYKNLGINTPRTELLPTRLFRYLGNICVGHGMNFDKMMEVLPRCQTGLGTEDCHPLFVACLLRLGDLFDLDDNRFCPVMAKHVSNMPSMSNHHHNKHLSLREFQLDKRTVKLVAECQDEMSYVETQNWFGWIGEEFQNQMSQWNLIVPNAKFGSLPTIEQLDVKIDGNKELLNHKPMKFALEEKNAIQILQGANLYKDISSVLRELIQNSIDATQIRIWLENKERLKNLSPLDSEFKTIIENYPIEIDFLEKSDGWYLSIKDNGVGFSLDDLNFVQKIAGSNKNFARKDIISQMPEWLKPSSYFGIGLQSAFLLADKIVFETKSFITNDIFSVEMHSPLKKNNGYCFIRKIQDISRKVGTTLEIPLNINELKNSFFVQDNYLKKFGFIEQFEVEKINLVFVEIVKKIKEIFSHECNIKIKFNSKEELVLNEILDKNEKSITSFGEAFDSSYWNEKLNIKFSIRKRSKINHKDNNILYFKGQLAKQRSYSNLLRKFSDLYEIGVDFYGLNASDCLNVNRDSWLDSFIDNFNKSFFNLIIKDVLGKSNGFENIDEEFFNFTKLLYESDLSCISNINFLTNNGFMTIDEIAQNKIFYMSNEYLPNYDSVLERFDIKIFLIVKNIDLLDMFLKYVTGFFFYRVEGFSVISIKGKTSIIFSRNEIDVGDGIDIYKIDSIINSLEYFLETKILNKCEHIYSREKYDELSFPIKISKHLLPEKFIKFEYKNEMVLPFYYSLGYIHFIAYVDYKKLIDKSLCNSLTVEDYNNFVSFFKEEISKISKIKFTGD
ncbi:ATP-binding protein [Acinetobacter nosocomialis]|uniref:HD domain-containing protein n=1 Tax=Acinetobacter nosocomialis TaxID=106654 RepID=UPI0025A1D653|nr:ATP-binding protein [Acinetobacter nosocomialis]MDX7903577.1 ATP-binding protein [Acinetobacter baumannii]MDX7905931.1 ATP-binding protein [Acinetobacter baumannii]MDX7926472.1 ATP-binding protein [Acinetobacter baumannii]